MARGKTKGWIMELKEFYITHNSDRISPNAQAMWHYLMYRANQNWWHYPLCLNVPEMAFALKMSSASVKRARDELTKKGYIRWESPGGARAARYYIMSRTGSKYAGQEEQEQKE